MSIMYVGDKKKLDLYGGTIWNDYFDGWLPGYPSDIIYSKNFNEYIVVGNTYIVQSYNGITGWNRVLESTIMDWGDIRSICEGKNGQNESVYVAGGTGLIAYYIQGTPMGWREIDTREMFEEFNTPDIYSIAYGNNIFIAVSDQQILIAPSSSFVIGDPHPEWTSDRTLWGEWRSICFGNGMFVAVALGGEIATTLNGNVWDSSIYTNVEQWHSVNYLNNQFIALGDTNKILTSKNPSSGFLINPIPGLELGEGSRITYGDGLYVITGHGKVFLSSDLVNWRTFPINVYGTGVCFNPATHYFTTAAYPGTIWRSSSISLFGNPASDIGFTPPDGMKSTNVQAALSELYSIIGSLNSELQSRLDGDG